MRASSKGIAERATVPAAEEEEDRAFLAKVASMKYAFGKPDDASAPVVANAVGATSAAEPTLLSKLAASAPKLQPPPFLSKRRDTQPKPAAPEYATKPRASSLIERMLDGEMARADPKSKPKPEPVPKPKPNQAWGATTEAMVETGLRLASIEPARVTVKVPVTAAGTAAAAELVQRGVRVCLTACYGREQALVAASVGAEYLAPYLGRMDDAGKDGMEECRAMQAAACHRLPPPATACHRLLPPATACGHACKRAMHTLCVHGMYTACTRHVHCMHMACTRREHCVCTLAG